MDEDKLRKLNALLRLAKSPEAHEAELAMKMAMKIAAELRVDLTSMEDSPFMTLTHVSVETGARLAFEVEQAFITAQAFFKVSCCRSGPRMTLVGAEHDCAIAISVYEFLVSACRRCLKGWQASERQLKRRVTPGKNRGFKKGFFIGIQQALAAQQAEQEQEYGLVPSNEGDRRQYLKTLFPRSKPGRPDKRKANSAAVVQGYRDGRGTSIHRPLATTLTLAQ